MARPKTYDGATVVLLAPDGNTTLKKTSDRRAIVNFLIDSGGKATIKEISEHFEMDMTQSVRSMVHSRWLAVKEEA